MDGAFLFYEGPFSRGANTTSHNNSKSAMDGVTNVVTCKMYARKTVDVLLLINFYICIRSNLMFDMKAITVLIIGFFSVGCASTTQIVSLPTGEISAPNNGMSRIILYRVSEIKGGPVGYKVIVNKKPIGQLGHFGFLYWDTNPGFKTLELRFDAPGQSSSGWKQFHTKSNGLTVLETSSTVGLGIITPSIRTLSGAEKEKVLSKLKRRAK
jgi:hypothetical protein